MYIPLSLYLLQSFGDYMNSTFAMWWVAWAGVVCGLHVGGRFLRGRRSRD